MSGILGAGLGLNPAGEDIAFAEEMAVAEVRRQRPWEGKMIVRSKGGRFSPSSEFIVTFSDNEINYSSIGK